MEYGIWNMEYGIWYMVYGVWNMEYGIWNMEYGSLTGLYYKASKVNLDVSMAGKEDGKVLPLKKLSKVSWNFEICTIYNLHRISV